VCTLSLSPIGKLLELQGTSLIPRERHTSIIFVIYQDLTCSIGQSLGSGTRTLTARLISSRRVCWIDGCEDGGCANTMATLLARREIVALDADRVVLQQGDMEHFVDRLGISEAIEGECE